MAAKALKVKPEGKHRLREVVSITGVCRLSSTSLLSAASCQDLPSTMHESADYESRTHTATDEKMR